MKILQSSSVSAALLLVPSSAFVQQQFRRYATLSSSLFAIQTSPDSQLAQLASMTTLSIDSGDLDVIRDFAATGYITDATTNPLFVSQAGLKGDAVYVKLVDDAVEYGMKGGCIVVLVFASRRS